MKETEPHSDWAGKFQGKRVLITGGLGMIGSTLAHKLVPLGANVTLLDACIAPFGGNLFNIQDIRDKVDLQFADIRDREAMKMLVRDQDLIFNFAAQVSHNDSIDDPFLDADINYFGHLNVVESVRHQNPKARILFSGSRLQFGKIERNPVEEDHPLRPKSPYAFNKTVAENMYRFYSEVHGISCVVFRIANPYGIRSQMKHSKYNIVNYFIRLAMEGREMTIFGDGSQLRDYIYIDDLAEAFLMAAILAGDPYQVYNVGSGVGVQFGEMVHKVQEIVGKGILRQVPWPADYLNIETGDYVTDIGKIRQELGWNPRTSLSEGIQKTFEYYTHYREHYWK